MKTLRNNIWMRYLTLGIIISISVFINSCIKEPLGVGHFYFVNQTNHSVTYDNLFQEYNLKPNQTILITQNQAKNNSFKLEDYFSPFLMKDKKVLNIKFDTNSCLLNQTITSEHSPLNIKEFVAEKLDKYNYKFTYTFTEADYNRAVACP